MNETLYKLFTTPGLSTTFGSRRALYEAAKKKHPNISIRDVEQWLNTMDAYTLHRMPRKNNQPQVMVSGIDEQWSADLCDMGNIAAYNDGFRYLLTVIDCFSKKADAEPVKDKSGQSVSGCFEKILERSKGRKPQQLETDQGKEFWNKTFKNLCSQNNINHFSTYSINKASTVERFNRTLKSLMYRYFTQNETYRWLEVLPHLLTTYNSRKHRSINMAPNSVNNKNENKVRAVLYKPKKGQKDLKIGDLVRISKARGTFDKG